MSGDSKEYVKPAVIRLDYEVDLTVRMSNCKTDAGTNSGAGFCGSRELIPCSSTGS